MIVSRDRTDDSISHIPTFSVVVGVVTISEKYFIFEEGIETLQPFRLIIKINASIIVEGLIPHEGCNWSLIRSIGILLILE